MATPETWSEADRRQIEARGLALEEAERQLALLRNPPLPSRLERPCRPGDGIARLPEEEHEELLGRWQDAARAGRLSKMVPASGAASRMFRPLLRLLHDGRSEADIRQGRRLLRGLEHFPFYPQLEQLLYGPAAPLPPERLDQALGELRLGTVLPALLAPEGLDLASLPKALLPFHRYPEGPRTAFAEHLVEAAGHVADADGLCRLHFTVAPEHALAFESHLEEIRPALEATAGRTFRVSFSHQSPATDTLALGEDGRPFREADGRLLFRPGGHGSLLRNLASLEGDIVLVKNIDNILPGWRREPVLLWKQLLTGHLLRLEERVFEVLRRLEAGGGEASFLAEALRFAARELSIDGALAALEQPAGEQRAFLARALDRPLRVCGMVPNAGEPGGGPFLVRSAEGRLSPQIVETSQIDRGDEGQAAQLARSTHFNPVDLVCSLRDHRGRPFSLERWVDPRTVFISHKSQGGRDLLALEHPGLWNGSMAGWNTVFVEVPAETFAPVKTIFDLLRPEHQPLERAAEAVER